MKKTIFSLLMAGILTFAGCKKDSLPLPAPEVNLSADETSQSLVDTLGAFIFEDPMTTSVTPTTDAIIMDYPLFLDYDPFTMVVARTNKIDSCVRGIETTKAEKELLNKAFLDKIECQKANKLAVARIHREIESWAKTQKYNYYLNWYMVEKTNLDADLKAGKITEAQYKEKISNLNKTWEGKMNYLNGQVKEKIKLNLQRSEACGKIKDCEKIYLDRVLEILGKERFKKWIGCYKYNYKKK